MTIVSIIVAMDEKRGIGLDNQLLCHLPVDLKHFKKITMNKPIIMGHNTYKSIGKPLAGRLNIVLSRKSLEIPGVKIANSIEDSFLLAANYPEIVIIGGEQIFKASLPFVNRIYLTIIHNNFDADTFFPDFNTEDWCCKILGNYAADEKNIYSMSFYQYDLIDLKNVIEIS